jgi:hypothetical protein
MAFQWDRSVLGQSSAAIQDAECRRDHHNRHRVSDAPACERLFVIETEAHGLGVVETVCQRAMSASFSISSSVIANSTACRHPAMPKLLV